MINNNGKLQSSRVIQFKDVLFIINKWFISRVDLSLKNNINMPAKCICS